MFDVVREFRLRYFGYVMFGVVREFRLRYRDQARTPREWSFAVNTAY